MDSLDYKKNTEYYILSGAWLQKWKKYVNLAPKEKDKSEMMEVENQNEDLYPGPIVQDDIIDEKVFNLLDWKEAENYSLRILKDDLIENQHFHIVDKQCWEFFEKKYKGLPIPRIAYIPNEKDQPVVELRLKKVMLNHFIFHIISIDPIYDHYARWKENAKFE